MNTVARVPVPPSRNGRLSILSVSLTVALAATSHAYDFGPAAFVVGGIGIALLLGLGLGYLLSGRGHLLVPYALLNVWIIGGFGVVGGFWNHAVKVAVCAAHGGTVPPAFASWFVSPDAGSLAYETVGILTFAASMGAAVFGYRLVRGALSRRGAAS